jgi:hypothetical protein
MKNGLTIDPDLPQMMRACYAVAHVKRGTRKRFPENCVEVVADEATARAQARPELNQHAVEVMGPSRSSEGLRLFYLVRWLDG